MTTPHVALTIAGSDSGGGAGIQADLRAFGQFGVFGASVITAVTAQNTVGVTDVHVIPAATVTAQIDAVLDDLPVAAVKTGMLATAELVELVAARAAAGELPNLVVDPVLVSATGHRLLEDSALAAYRDLLLPHATIATPNLDEAAALLGRPLRTLDDARAAAHALADLGTRVVVVKGGHLEGPHAVDVVVVDGDDHELGGGPHRHPEHPRHRLHLRRRRGGGTRQRPRAARRSGRREALRHRRDRRCGRLAPRGRQRTTRPPRLPHPLVVRGRRPGVTAGPLPTGAGPPDEPRPTRSAVPGRVRPSSVTVCFDRDGHRRPSMRHLAALAPARRRHRRTRCRSSLRPWARFLLPAT